MGEEGARSQANCRLLDALLRLGSLVVTDGVTIAVDQTVGGGIPCLRMSLYLPQTCHSTGVRSIPLLVPAACVGTDTFQSILIFYALIEEIMGWLAGVGPNHIVVRLYCDDYGQPLARSRSPAGSSRIVAFYHSSTSSANYINTFLAWAR